MIDAFNIVAKWIRIQWDQKESWDGKILIIIGIIGLLIYRLVPLVSLVIIVWGIWTLLKKIK